MAGDISVRIRGIDRSDWLYYQGSFSFNRMRNSRGTASLPFVLSAYDGFRAQMGDTVEIFNPTDVRVWAGTCEDVEEEWKGDRGWHVRTLSAISCEALYDAEAVNRQKFAGQRAGAIVAALHASSGVTRVTLGRIDAGPVIKSLEVSNIAQGFTQCCTFAGFIWYVDPIDMTLNFHSAATIEGDLVLTHADVKFESMKFKQSRGEYRSAVQVQQTGASITTKVFTGEGDGETTVFTLPVVPASIVGVELSAGTSAVEWFPGSAQVTLTPAPGTASPLVTVEVVIRYTDNTAAVGAGPSAMYVTAQYSKTTVYTRTRTFTAAGAEQEAAAIQAAFSLLPSQLTLTTDTPGARIGRTLALTLGYPVSAGELLNGKWIVQEIDAAIVPGLEMRGAPFGNFRYTLHLVGADATAVFPGDGVTEDFTLAEIPSDVSRVEVWNGGDDPSNPPDPYYPDNPDNPYPYDWEWTPDSPIVTITPAPPDTASVVIGYDPASYYELVGDGSTTDFELPETPKSVDAINVYDENPVPISGPGGTLSGITHTVAWGGVNRITVTPAMPDGTSAIVRMTAGRAPDVPTFVDTWNQLADKGPLDIPVLGGVPPIETPVSGTAVYVRTLLLRDLTVGDDVADHVPVFRSGTGLRVLGVLRKAITADLVVTLLKNGAELLTVTIPSGTSVDDVIIWPLSTESPPVTVIMSDGEVLSANITASDGSKDKNGIASFTIEWE